jgi:hypothetical protein
MFIRFLLIGALALGVAAAQDEGGGGGGGGGNRGGGGSRGFGGGMSMPMRPQLPTPLERMTTAFALTKEQKKEFKTLIDGVAKDAVPVREQILKGRAQLLEAAQTGRGQDEMKKLVDDQAALMARMTHLEMTVFGTICRKVSAEQRKQGAAALFALVPNLFMKKDWDSN